MNFIRNQKGAVAVETAIIFMLMLALLFGIIEFGLVLFDKQILTNASREGARAGVVVGLGRSGGDSAEYLAESATTATGYCASSLITFGTDQTGPVVSATWNDADGNGSPTRGDDLTVSLTYSYDFLVLSALGIGPVSLQSVSSMKLE